VTRNLGELIETNYPIQYFNVSNSNIQLEDLVLITFELKAKQKLEYVNIGGNKITKCKLAPKSWRKYDPAEILARARSDPAQVRDKLSQELVSNVCDLIEAYSKGISQVALKYLDISDMGFSKKHLRQILVSLRKNTTLRSINFGCLPDGE